MSKNAILVEQVLVPCIDTPNINGRTYTMAAVESMVEQINASPAKGFVFSDAESAVQKNLERIVGLIQRAYIKNGQMMVDVKFLPTPVGNIIEGMLQYKKFSIRTMCEVTYNGGVIESPEYLAAFFCDYQEN